MGYTQESLTREVCAYFTDALADLRLKKPADADETDAAWVAPAIWPYYIPINLTDTSATSEQVCPCVVVTPTNTVFSPTSAICDEVTAHYRIGLFSWDPGTRANPNAIDKPDAQGWVTPLAFADRVLLKLREADCIGDCALANISAHPRMVQGEVEDIRPYYWNFVEFDLIYYAPRTNATAQDLN